MIRRYRSRPFLTWQGFVVGAVITVVALAIGWAASRAFPGVAS